MSNSNDANTAAAATFRDFLKLPEVADAVINPHFALADHGVEFPEKIEDLIGRISWPEISDDELLEEFRALVWALEGAATDLKRELDRFESDYQANALMEGGE